MTAMDTYRHVSTNTDEIDTVHWSEKQHPGPRADSHPHPHPLQTYTHQCDAGCNNVRDGLEVISEKRPVIYTTGLHEKGVILGRYAYVLYIAVVSVNLHLKLT